jgi:hypothetical protein
MTVASLEPIGMVEHTSESGQNTTMARNACASW